MKISKSYGLAFLSVLLSLSMALPYCCHADISGLFSHTQDMASHSTHDRHQDAQKCDCGHEFVKDYQKTKKAADSQSTLLVQHGLSIPGFSYHLSSQPASPWAASPRDNMVDTGPPLYILNSVFLN